ncbi:MAG: tetratricopeptide repeat protein, partial [Caldilineae bacterium]
DEDTPQAEASYIHYAVEYDDIEAIYRDVEGLRPAEQQRRLQDLGEPAPPQRWTRRLTVFLDSIFDLASDGLASVVGSETPIRAVVIDLPNVPQQSLVVGYTGNRYDPLLERSLGKRVVCQMVLGDALYERVGRLHTYSRQFLLLCDVPFPREHLLTVRPQESMPTVVANVRVVHTGQQLEVTNLTPYPLLLDALHMGERVRDLGMVLEPKATFRLNIEVPQASECSLVCKVVRKVDLIIPRSRAVVRYRAGRDDTSYLYDVGIALSERAYDQKEEERLRWELRNQPGNAVAAASLARLLYRKGALAEAERYYRQALSQPRSLPDSGKRIARELEHLRRLQDHSPETTP